MRVANQQTRYCLQCAHGVWPRHERGYCGHPDAHKSGTVECRDVLGACGPDAKLYAEPLEPTDA